MPVLTKEKELFDVPLDGGFTGRDSRGRFVKKFTDDDRALIARLYNERTGSVYAYDTVRETLNAFRAETNKSISKSSFYKIMREEGRELRDPNGYREPVGLELSKEQLNERKEQLKAIREKMNSTRSINIVLDIYNENKIRFGEELKQDLENAVSDIYSFYEKARKAYKNAGKREALKETERAMGHYPDEINMAAEKLKSGNDFELYKKLKDFAIVYSAITYPYSEKSRGNFLGSVAESAVKQIARLFRYRVS